MVFVVGALGLFVVVMVLSVARRPTISAADARLLLADGAQLVDVRSPAEFAGGHADGACNVPVNTLDERMAELEPKDRSTIVYCASGVRSAVAARKLRRAGWKNVHNLGGLGNAHAISAQPSSKKDTLTEKPQSQ